VTRLLQKALSEISVHGLLQPFGTRGSSASGKSMPSSGKNSAVMQVSRSRRKRAAE